MFNIEDHRDIIKKYRSGEKKINVCSTALMFLTLKKVWDEVNRDLVTILDQIKSPQFPSVRKLVVDYSQLDTAELYLFAAF